MKGMIAMNAERVSEEYMKGTRVVLSEMAGEEKMPSGLRGTVTSVHSNAEPGGYGQRGTG